MKDKQARVEEITEWLQFLADATRFGADNIRAGQIADVLVYGSPQQGGSQ